MDRRPGAGLAHVPELDGVRGLAIAAVLLQHTVGASAGRVLGSVLATGWIGVDLFFVLSGYLITSVLLAARGTRHYFRDFYARRVLRIAPLYFAIVALSFTCLKLLIAFDDSWRELLTYAAYTQNLVHHASFGVWPLRVTWSLAIEEQFYLVWPLAVLWLGPSRLRAACAAIVLAEPALRAWALESGTAPITTYVFTPYRLDGLAAGAFVASLVHEHKGPPAAWLLPASLTSLAAALAIGISQPERVVVATSIRSSGAIAATSFIFTLLALGFSGALFWLLGTAERDSAVHRFLRRPSLRLLGKLSYGLYLFHAIVIPLDHEFIRPKIEQHLGGHGPLATSVSIVVEYAIFGSLAGLSSRYFESFFLSLKGHFSGARTGEAPALRPVIAGHASRRERMTSRRPELTVGEDPYDDDREADPVHRSNAARAIDAK